MTISATIITVSYNSATPLEQLLLTIPKGYPVVVVDNASEDNSVEIARQYGAKVICNERNFGLSRACNIGACFACTEYLFFLNPDTELQPNTIEELYKATKRHPDASAFAPILLGESGLPSLMSKSVLVPSSTKPWIPKKLPKNDFEVPAILGAAVFVSSSNFNKVGKFDENLFLYYEDDDLSYRLRQMIGRVMVVGSAKMKHLGKQSSSPSTELSNLRRYHFFRSKTYVTQKHNVEFSPARKVIEFTLKLVLFCLIAQRNKQARYYYSALGILSTMNKDRFKITRYFLASVERIFNL